MFDLSIYFRTYHYLTPTVDMYYPVIYGLEDMDVQRKINYQITDLLYNIISELRSPDTITYITGFYEIKTNERKVLSINLTGTADYGGIHPITIVKALNIDVKTGKVYTLDELFKPNSDYIKIISDMVRQQIDERDIYLLGEFIGIDDKQDYYIADKNIIIYFQLYEITPYASGFPYFSIPLYKLKHLIPEGSILEKLMYYV